MVDDAVALGGGYGGEAYAGIAGGRLDDDAAGLELALGLGVLYHGLGDAVLDAAGGIEVFQLYEDGRLEGEVLFQIDDLHQRRIAY